MGVDRSEQLSARSAKLQLALMGPLPKRIHTHLVPTIFGFWELSVKLRVLVPFLRIFYAQLVGAGQLGMNDFAFGFEAV